MNKKQSGLVFLHKPPGITSFQALHTLKKKLGHGKVGHTGTLDKFAEGLLIALAGKNTKLVPYFEGLDKTYVATIKFGATTETLDTESPEIEPTTVPDFAKIESGIHCFEGYQEQTPPQYSAVHVNGTRAYQRKLKGQEVELPSRNVTIYSIKILQWASPLLQAEIRCSKGTYIRAFARDLGLAVGSKAYLQELKRTHIGPFTMENAVSPEDFNSTVDLRPAATELLRLPWIKKQEISEQAVSKVLNGSPIQFEWLKGTNNSGDGMYALIDRQQELCALAELKNNEWKYRYVAERN